MRPNNQRQLRTHSLDPKLQISYVLYFFTFSVVAGVLHHMMLVRAAQTVLLEAMVTANGDVATFAANIASPLRNLGWGLAMLFPALGLAGALFVIRITHRFVGPQGALRRQIKALTHGDYAAMCRLRGGDELKPLAADLNDLATSLRQRG